MLFNRLYSFLLTILSPLFYLYWFIQSIKHGVPLNRITERFGYVPNLPKNAIWIHAASIGELNVANMIKPHITHLGPVIISSSTCRGATTSHTDFFLPYDHPLCVKKALSRLNPKAMILIETEVWPNLIKYLTCPIYLVNARMSNKSFDKYMRIRPFIVPSFKKLSGVWSSSDVDAQRLAKLGAHIINTHPNVKYLSAKKPDEKQNYKRNTIVFSCTHPGEETMLIPVFKKIIASRKSQKIVLIPRHAHRKKGLEKELSAYKANILIEDRFGYTHHWYKRAKLVFIGGSLISHGGQNPIEPLIYSCPTVIGPHYFNFQNVVDGLLKNALIHVVQTPNELTQLCLTPPIEPSPWPFIENQIKQIEHCLDELTACLS